MAAIEQEPGAYAATILGDLEHYASFGHWTNRVDTPFTHWRFATTLNGPQRVIFLPGTVMAAILLASVAAGIAGLAAADRLGARTEARLPAEALAPAEPTTVGTVA